MIVSIALAYPIVLIAFLFHFPKVAGRWWADFKIGYGERMAE
jgi:hypothetical protein